MTRTYPINITVNTEVKCNLLCNYSFSYPPTTLKIYRNAYPLDLCPGLYLIPDETARPPVIYNNRNYHVTDVMLVRPSFHKFAGISADAEMIIVHTSDNFPNKLFVCIPIMKSSTSTTDATMFLDLIGAEISNTGTGENGETVFNNPTFTLNKFVPMKPYVSYTGRDAGIAARTKSNGVHIPARVGADKDIIVFKKENALYISNAIFDNLTKTTSTGAEPLWPTHISQIANSSDTPPIFYNSTGPVVRAGDSIYISCQPTGADGEILTKLLPNSSQMIDRLSVKSATNKLFVKIVIGILLMIIIWKLAMKIIRGLSGSKKKD